MNSSDFTPRRNHVLVGEGLHELRQALMPLVQKHMAATYGDNWRVHAKKILELGRLGPVGDDFEHDVANLLKIILHDLKTFVPTLKSNGRTLVAKLLTVRNQWAHEAELDISDTFHAHECLCKLFALLKYDAPEIVARRAALRALLP